MKNLLVEYKGGGFDGCFWQWNYFMWDSNGDFINLHSTGYKGVKNQVAARMLLSDTDHCDFDSITQLDLTDKTAVLEFVEAGNSSLMVMLAKENEELGELLNGRCDDCGKVFPVLELLEGGYSGDGGLAISAKCFSCEDCYYKSEESEFYAISTLIYGDYVLKLGDVSKFENGRSYHSYVLLWDDDILFSGDDFSPSPMGASQDLDMLMSLLGFLTIGIDDTDPEYFKNYNQEQLEFAKDEIGDREYLSCLAMDFESREHQEYYDLSVEFGEYDNPIYTITDKEG